MDDVEGLIGRLRAEAQAAADGAKMLGMLSAPASKKAAASYVGLAALYEEAASALTRLQGERDAAISQRDEARKGLETLGTEAALLLTHAEGCVRNHTAETWFANPEMPPWLRQTRERIEAARSLLSKVSSYG